MAGRVRSVTGSSGPGGLARARRLLDAWEVAAAPAGSIASPAELELAGLRWFPAQVPGTAAGALRAAGAWSWDEPRRFDAEDWWWRVVLTGDERGDHVLGLDGIASLFDVWCNGTLVRSGTNMFVASTDRIMLHGGDVLVIRCRALDAELAKKRPRPGWRVPMLEQQQLRWVRTTLLGRTPGWSPPAAAVGPWRAVWIERAGGFTVDELEITARIEGETGVVAITATFAPEYEIDRADIVVTRGSSRVTTPLNRHGLRWSARAIVAAPERWWPHTHGEPARYAVSIAGSARGVAFVVDLGFTGFRTIEVDRTDGDFAVRVNGVPVFCRGACWTPLDVVTLGATAEQYAAAIAQARCAGMNMLRVGGTMVYEDAAFYDALDAHGILLWQDLMFANMEYPDDPELRESIAREVDQQTARLAARPSLAIACGNSEGQQQAAMSGASSDRWAPALFHEVIPALIRVRLPDVAYVASSTDGGAFPHQPSAGVSSYYGVGAYLRPLEDARRSEVRFASECLAFANIPVERGLPGGPALRVHHAAWKARAPRDLGAGWDFDDVRDHYVQRLFGVDPAVLRATDHERYLALGRAATGEVMAQCFGEWRRARSVTRGALVWFLRDLWPGAGWGVVDATGAPKPAWYALRRALAPIALAITDEGCNGLALHAVNDTGEPVAGRLEVTLYRAGETRIGHGAKDIAIPAHGALELDAASLFEGFYDLSYAYRFGPPQAQVVHATLARDGHPLVETFAFPAGLGATRELAIGLTASVSGHALTIATQRFAQFVTIDAPGTHPEDNGFHLAPGQSRTICLGTQGAVIRGTVSALNAEAGARFEVKP